VAYLDAYGLSVNTDIDLPGTCASMSSTGPHVVTVRRAAASELPSLLGEPRYLRNLQAYDDTPFVMMESPAGDVMFAYGRGALLHLSRDLSTLRYAVTDEGEPKWQRVFLDTILWTVSLLRGFELLHAAAVKTPHGLVALVARTGGGKTSLAAEYVRRGATLFSDDIVALEESHEALLARPGPALMNLPRAIDPDQVAGRVVGDFGAERWVALERSDATPIPLRAVVLINRVAGNPSRCTPTAATALTLLPFAVTLPHLADGARRRFELFATLAATAAVLSLHADPAVPPAGLVDLIERALVTL
jgi:hypothetical protein